jgi:hypothetical protein
VKVRDSVGTKSKLRRLSQLVGCECDSDVEGCRRWKDEMMREGLFISKSRDGNSSNMRESIGKQCREICGEVSQDSRAVCWQK